MKVDGKKFAQTGKKEKEKTPATVIWGFNNTKKNRRQCTAWDSELDYIEGCPKEKDFEANDIDILYDAYLKINLLYEHFDEKSSEFGAYLIGAVTQENGKDCLNSNLITDVYCPEQVVTITSVDFTNDEEVDNIIGVIHSHPGASKDFSSHDEDFFNANNDLSFLISRSGIKATRRIELPCGAFSRKDVKLFIVYPQELMDWLDNNTSKVTEYYPISEKWQRGLSWCHKCKSYHATKYDCEDDALKGHIIDWDDSYSEGAEKTDPKQRYLFDAKDY